MKSYKIFGIATLLITLLIGGCNLFVGIGDEDTTPPTLVITSPQNNSVYSPGLVIFTGAANDNDRVRDVMLRINQSDWISLGNKSMW